MNPFTGTVTDWHPALNDAVRTVATGYFRNAPGGPVSLVAVGGEFDAFGGVARRNLAAINLETGAVLPWRPAPDGVVRALHARAGMLYAGGDFTHIDQQARRHLAAFSLGSRQLASWNPDADGPVHALASLAVPAPTENVSTTPGSRLPTPDAIVTIYAGGDFDTIGGLARSKVAAISAASGAATPWAPAGGKQFTTLGGAAASHLVRLNTTTGAADAGWNPAPDGEVRAIQVGRGS